MEGFNEQLKKESVELPKVYDYVFQYFDGEILKASEPISAETDMEARDKFEKIYGRPFGLVGEGFSRTESNVYRLD